MELNKVSPFDFLLTENENGLEMQLKISSPPENSETVMGFFLDRPMACVDGVGGRSLGKISYGTSHRCCCASLMCTLNRSSVSCLMYSCK